MKRNKGFTLLIAVVTTSILLLVSFVVANIALKQLILSYSNQESQYAFYAADSGAECATYWDSQQNPSVFSPGAHATFAQIYITEYSGIDTNSPFDKFSTNTGTGSGAANQPVNSGSKSLIYPNELVFGHAEVDGGTISEGPGFTHITYANQNDEEYKTIPSTGSYSADFLITSSRPWIAMMGAFKPASGQTPLLIQENQGGGNFGFGAEDVEFDNPSTNGNLIIAVFSYNTQASTIGSVTDNKGNTYIRVGSPLVWPVSPYTTELWYAINQAASGGSRIEVSANSPALISGDIQCNGQNISTNSQTVNTNPPQQSKVGNVPTSIFQLNFTKGCAIVTITKDPILDTTTIESRGYNTCDTTAPRRFERAVRVTY